MRRDEIGLVTPVSAGVFGVLGFGILGLKVMDSTSGYFEEIFIPPGVSCIPTDSAEELDVNPPQRCGVDESH